MIGALVMGAVVGLGLVVAFALGIALGAKLARIPDCVLYDAAIVEGWARLAESQPSWKN